jgi:hypothetical protein
MAKRHDRALSWILALSVLLTAAVTACGGQHVSLPVPGGDCPYHTAGEWQSFLDHWASDPRWVKTCEEGGCDDTFVRAVDEDVRKVFDRCADLLAQSPGLAACTGNLRRFTPGWMHQHSPDSYGFSVDNRTYFAAQEAPGEPAGMMIPPPDLVAAVPDVAKITAVCRSNGWEYLEQASCLGASRLFVLVTDPGGRFDQWILLNLYEYTPGPDAAPAVDVGRTVSFLAVQKQDAGGHALPRVRLHFRDYTLAKTPDHDGYHLTLGVENNTTKCYACHPSGTRQLIPRRTPLLHAAPVRGEPGYGEVSASVSTSMPAGFGLQRLAELNRRLGSYGPPDWNGLVDVPALGPAIGKESGCTRCHDGSYRGVLTVATSETQLDEKVDYELAMPPAPGLLDLLERSELTNPALTRAEEKLLEEAREAHRRLDEKVHAGRAPALRQWMLETQCR